MEKLLNALEQKLGPIADKLSNNPYLKAITRGTMCALPLTLVAGLIILIAKPPIPVANGGTDHAGRMVLLGTEADMDLHHQLGLQWCCRIGLFVRCSRSISQGIKHERQKQHDLVAGCLFPDRGKSADL